MEIVRVDDLSDRKLKILKLGFISFAAVNLLMSLAYLLKICTACSSGPNFAYLGTAFYFSLTLIVFTNRLNLASYISKFAFLFHLFLVSLLISKEQFCALCFISFAGSIGLLVISMLYHENNMYQIGKVIPLWLLAVVFFSFTLNIFENEAQQNEQIKNTFFESGILRDQDPYIEVVVFENPGCGWCKKLKNDTLKPFIEEYSGQNLISAVNLTHAKNYPFIKGTPTISIFNKRTNQIKTIAGYIPYEKLKQEIEQIK